MDYFLKSGQTSRDIFFWMAELTRTMFHRAAFSIEEEELESERLTVGLDEAMYARLCPNTGSYDVTLSMENGNAIVYEAEYPKVLRVVGMEEFVNKVMELPQPKHHVKFSYGDLWTNAQFQMLSEFMSESSANRLRKCLSAAKNAGLKMQVSSTESGGRAVSVTSGDMLLGYKDIIDVILSDNNDRWILMHISTGMVYTSGFKLTVVEEMLSNIIKKG